MLVVSYCTRFAFGLSVQWNGTSSTGGVVMNSTVLCGIAYWKITSGGTGDIVLSASFAADALAMVASKIQGLASGSSSGNNSSNSAGTPSTTPSPGAINPGTSVPAYLAVAVGTNGPSADSDGTYDNSFVDGQHDGTSGGADTDNARICEGYKIVGSAGSETGSKTGITSRNWSAVALGLY